MLSHVVFLCVSSIGWLLTNSPQSGQQRFDWPQCRLTGQVCVQSLLATSPSCAHFSYSHLWCLACMQQACVHHVNLFLSGCNLFFSVFVLHCSVQVLACLSLTGVFGPVGQPRLDICWSAEPPDSCSGGQKAPGPAQPPGYIQPPPTPHFLFLSLEQSSGSFSFSLNHTLLLFSLPYTITLPRSLSLFLQAARLPVLGTRYV